ADRLAAGPLDLNSIIDIGQQTAEALAEAHDRGVVHRDIKSGNIMITARGKVKVLDFGLAKPLRHGQRPRAPGRPPEGPRSSASKKADEHLTESGILLGTVSYMSPEQASGNGEVTHLSDLFSLGIVLYEATTGRLPFDGDTYFQTIEAITRRATPSIKRSRRDAPATLIAIIERLLKKSPAERYQSATQVAEDLGKLGQ